MNKREATDRLRKKTLERVSEFLTANQEEVLQTKSGTIAFPAIDEMGTECFVTVTIQIPQGARDGTGYDGHEEARNYELETLQKQETKAAKEALKQKKIERDKKMREEKKKKEESST